jgi:hypothetical protein
MRQVGVKKMYALATWRIFKTVYLSLASLVADARNCRYEELIKKMLARGN